MVDKEGLEGIGLIAVKSNDVVVTGRKVTVEDGELVKTYLEEFVNYYGGEEDGSVQRRWMLKTMCKKSFKSYSSHSLTDSMVFEFFPEAGIELPEPPEDVGKSRAELALQSLDSMPESEKKKETLPTGENQ